MTITQERPTTTTPSPSPSGETFNRNAAQGHLGGGNRKAGTLPTTGSPLTRPKAAAHLSDADVARLGDELDTIRDEVMAARGARDAAYIRRVIKVARALEVGGKALTMFARNKRAMWLGMAAIGTGKILENMEIGHNVLHGQWDWMRDPDIHSTTWEWDFVAPARGWQHTHNDLHHTYTNVVGKDRDVGYNILRIRPDQPWQPRDRFNPLMNLILSPIFEWGIASYDLEWDMVKAGVKSRAQFDADLDALKKKAVKMVLKDYIATPLLAQVVSRSGKQALAATVGGNIIRNVWAHTVIFCGHFPDGVDVFPEEVIEGETRGDWYVRQMLGSANLSGSRLFHIMTGNLSHQIEHHLFPDMPSNHYIEIAPKVRDICRRYGLTYTTGPLLKQYGETWRTIIKLSFPDGHRWGANPA